MYEIDARSDAYFRISACTGAESTLELPVNMPTIYERPSRALITFPYAGRPEEGELMHETFIPFDFRIPVDFLGSYWSVGIYPAAPAVLHVLKNGVEFGTIGISVAGVVTPSCAETTFAPGQRLGIQAPSPRDDTLADISVALAGLLIF